MSHGNDDDSIIIFSSREKIGHLPADTQEKIEAILEKANKEANKVLENNPNLG